MCLATFDKLKCPGAQALHCVLQASDRHSVNSTAPVLKFWVTDIAGVLHLSEWCLICSSVVSGVPNSSFCIEIVSRLSSKAPMGSRESPEVVKLYFIVARDHVSTQDSEYRCRSGAECNISGRIINFAMCFWRCHCANICFYSDLKSVMEAVRLCIKHISATLHAFQCRHGGP